MDKDTIIPAIAFRPAGVMRYDGLSAPPHTRLFQVNGLRDNKLNWHNSPEEISPYYNSTPSPKILGIDIDAVEALESQARRLLDAVNNSLINSRHSCVFVADDLGGSIAKLALVIAAEEAMYQKVLDATQTVIFVGTPHRGSPKRSLDLAIYSVIRACFRGILGDWFQETLKSLTQCLEDIDRKFCLIAHKFKVVSYYQDQPTSTSGPYEVIAPKEFATIGLEMETTIGVSRPYDKMGILMNRQAHVVRVFLENSRIWHWDEFLYFMDRFQPAGLGAEYDGQPWLSRKSATLPSDFYRNNPELLGWVSSELAPRYLRLALKSSADPVELLRAAAKAIWETPEALWIACPSINLYDSGASPPDKCWILASLINQLLMQQPQAFLRIRDLLPHLADAMHSDTKSWKERCLWQCLKTLIYRPVGVAMYGFLNVETDEGIEVLRQIDSTLEGTESKLRLVLVLGPRIETGIDNSHFVHLNLPSNDGPFTNTGNMAVKDMTRLSRNDLEGLIFHIREIERPDFIALTWIAFATRPLSLEEIEAAAALDQVQQGGAGFGFNKGSPLSYEKSLGVRLRDLLPEVVEIDSNRAFLRSPYKLVREVLSSCKPPGYRVDEDWSPHLYLAEKCLGLVKAIPESAYDQLAIGFTAYAACNWIYHYKRASIISTDLPKVCQAYSDVVNEKPTVQSWLAFVEYLSLPPSQREESPQTCLKISESRLERLLDIGNIEDLTILYKLASRPSTLCGFGRLLVHAAETTNNDILEKIYKEPLSLEQEEVSRALATSHGTVHDTLMKEAASILDEYKIFRMQLEAHVLGNTAVSENLVSKLTSLPDAGERGLVAGVLIVALEYGDEKVIDDVCNSCRDARWHHNISLTGSGLDDGNNWDDWSVLHVAAKHGSEKAVSSILGSDSLPNISSIPGSQSPLYLAAAQGFPRIVPHLISSKELVDDRNGTRGMSALHIASLLGHRKTVETLLHRGANPTASDYTGLLHLAIRQDQWHIAKLLVRYFPIVSEPHGESNSGTDDISVATSDRDDAQEQASPGGSTMPNFGSTPLNKDEVVTLTQAVDLELADVCIFILEKGGDPKIQDNTGKTSLHVAAEAGSAAMVRYLLERGSKPGQVTKKDHCTPMHYACSAGATEVVDLLKDLTDLSVEDCEKRTPIAAAAYAGHLETVKLLRKSYDDAKMARALCDATHQGHSDVVEYLLNSGCSVDGDSSRLVPLLEVDPENEVMTRLLVQRGANLELENSSGEQAIHRAAEGGMYEATKLLLDHGSTPETETEWGRTPLTLAIESEKPEVVRLLLERDAKIRLPRCYGVCSSVLSFAMDVPKKMDMSKKMEVVNVLLEYYAKGKHEDGLTCDKALTEAVKRGQDEVIILILDTWLPSEPAMESTIVEAVHYAVSTMSIHDRSPQSLWPLFSTPPTMNRSDNTSVQAYLSTDGGAVLTKLLQHDAGRAALNAKMPGKPAEGTPLHTAVMNGNKTAVNILLKAGADYNAVSDCWGTILHTACCSGKMDMIQHVLSIAPGTGISTTAGKHGSVFQAAVFGFSNGEEKENAAQVFELLQHNGADPSTIGGHYSTPLHAAISFKAHRTALDWLMENSSSSLLVSDMAGRIPLNLAIIMGQKEIIKDVFEKTKGPHPDRNWACVGVFSLLRGQKHNPLHYAVMSATPEIVSEVLSWLKEDPEEGLLRSFINAVDFDGWTPLHWACRQGSSEIVKMLVDSGASIKARTDEDWTPRQVAVLQGFKDAEFIKSLGVANDEADTSDELHPPGNTPTHCSVCHMRICQRYYRCQNDLCRDPFDLCFKCYQHSERIHYRDHEFCSYVLG